jgi:hypothetical protein
MEHGEQLITTPYLNVDLTDKHLTYYNMPIPKPESGELEEKYISRCISEIASEYDAEGQAYAVCKGEFDKSTEMSFQTEDEIKALPEPKASEGREQYIRRCLPTIYKEGGKYDQRVATSMCADRYEKSDALASRKLDSFNYILVMNNWKMMTLVNLDILNMV